MACYTFKLIRSSPLWNSVWRSANHISA